MTGPADPFAPNDGTADRNSRGIGFWALVRHQFGNWRMSVRPKLLRPSPSLQYRAIPRLRQWMGGRMLPCAVQGGRRAELDHLWGVTLAANAVVVCDVAPKQVAGGVPAQFIGRGRA